MVACASQHGPPLTRATCARVSTRKAPLPVAEYDLRARGLLIDQPDGPAVFRVRLDGDDLDDAAKEALSRVNGWWEGTRSAPSEPFHHRVLVEANTPEEAIRTVQATIASHGKFRGFSATPVTNFKGDVWRGRFYRRCRRGRSQWPRRGRLKWLHPRRLVCVVDLL